MIDLQQVVFVVLYLLGAAAVFGLLFFLIGYVERSFPGEAMTLFAKVARIFLVILAVLVLIGVILQFLGGPTLFRWGTHP